MTRKNVKKYERKLRQRLIDEKSFLVEKLRREWDEIQMTARRERLVQQARTGGLIMARLLLVLLAVGGVITVAAIAPNMFAAFGRLSDRRGFFERKHFNCTKSYLKKRKFITISHDHQNNIEIHLTNLGFEHIIKDTFDNIIIAKPKKWDGMWRLVVFDIPEKYKWARDSLRYKLRAMGFYQLQKSVFVTPYPCENEISFLISLYSVQKFVRLIKSQHLSDDSDLRAHFGV